MVAISQPIQFGVSHGSNFGPVLFSIFYINDISSILLCYSYAVFMSKASKDKDLETLMDLKVEIAGLGMNASKLTVAMQNLEHYL